MEVFEGRLFIDVSTLVKQTDEEDMKNKAHENFTSELFEELSILLGDKGYMTGCIGANLEHVVSATEYDVKHIESHVDKTKRQIHHVYNKAKSYRHRVE